MCRRPNGNGEEICLRYTILLGCRGGAGVQTTKKARHRGLMGPQWQPAPQPAQYITVSFVFLVSVRQPKREDSGVGSLSRTFQPSQDDRGAGLSESTRMFPLLDKGVGLRDSSGQDSKDESGAGL